MTLTMFEGFYLLIIAALSLYGIHRYWLVWGSRRQRSPRTVDADLTGREPSVLIQIPIYNERIDHVLRLIDSALAVDWPKSRLEIQVLDDSDDGSEHQIAREIANRASRGAPIEHVQRDHRNGYKAGALSHGLTLSSAEFIAIFDADFVIPDHFLSRTIPCFDDGEIGMVQARWAFLNEDCNMLTRIQAVMLDGHFRVDHRARSRAGRFFNFNGTAGVWRRAAIDAVGGWRHDNITEDLDLSLRAWLGGWRFRYLDDLAVQSELPEQMPAYKVQQNRWVSGSVHTACSYLPTLLRNRSLPLRDRIDSLFYLTGNLTYMLLLGLQLSILPAILLRLDHERHVLLWSDVPFILLATVSVFVYCGQVRGNRPFLAYYLVRLPALMALGLGMTLHNTRAILKGVLGRARVFERTPKGAGAVGTRRPRDPVTWLEAAMALYVSICVAVCVVHGSLIGLPFLGLFVGGYLYVLRLSTRRLPAGPAPAPEAPNPGS